MYQVGYFLTRNATMLPDKLAVAHKDGELTYSQLNERANRLANSLLELGIGKGDRVAVFMPNSLEIVILWYATQKIGATFVPVNLRLLTDEVAHILQDAECTVAVYSKKFENLVSDAVLKCSSKVESLKIRYLICKDTEESDNGIALDRLIQQGDPSEPVVDVNSEDESTIIYTSGTTGKSKGVMHTQQMVKEYSYMMALESLNPNKASTTLVHNPMFHLGGLQHIWRTAALCGTLVLLNKIVPEDVFHAIEKYKVTEYYLLPPILIKRLHDHPKWREYDLSSVECVMCTGGKCSRDIAEMIFEMFPQSQIRLSYGSSETFGPLTTYVTKEQIRERPELATTIGKINNQVEMRIVDEKGNDVPDGTPGEALVRSPMLFKGYLNLPEKNKAVFDSAGWFHTEDVLYRTADGYYFIVDRIKDMIKTGGENVYAQKVESILRDFDGIFDCAIIGIPDPEMEEGVAVAIVTHDGNTLDAEKFISECKLKMTGYERPRYWCFLDELPKNSVGKIQKSVLREHPEWFERIKK